MCLHVHVSARTSLIPRWNYSRLSLQALKPYHTVQECDLRDLEAAYVSCNRQPIDNWMQNQTYCHVPGNGTILEYHCVDGEWKLSTGTGKINKDFYAFTMIMAGRI